MKLKFVLVLVGIAASLFIGSSRLSAQEAQQPPQREGGGRGGFDPAQMQQRMMERVREQFDVKSDDEWKVIQDRLQKVMEVRLGVGFGGFGFGRGGRGAGRNGGNAQPGGDNQNQGGRGGSLFRQSAEAEALQKAIDSKGSADELKAAMANFRAARKDQEAALEKAQEELREVLSARQEAIAVMWGMLK